MPASTPASDRPPSAAGQLPQLLTVLLQFVEGNEPEQTNATPPGLLVTTHRALQVTAQLVALPRQVTSEPSPTVSTQCPCGLHSAVEFAPSVTWQSAPSSQVSDEFEPACAVQPEPRSQARRELLGPVRLQGPPRH